MNLHPKEKILILAIIICGLVAMTGYSFAYFVSDISFTNSGNTSIRGGVTDVPEVTFDGGSSAINLVDAYPSKKASKDFSVSVGPAKSGTVSYTINLKISANSFVKCTDSTNATCSYNAEELKYTLKRGTTVLTIGDLTGQTGNILLYSEDNPADATYNYTLEVEFVDTKANQSHNENKTLTASLSVEM